MLDPRSPQILVVDDHDSVRYARVRTLRRAGFEVLEAATGRDALSMIAQHRPGLVILDVQLPDINGLDVCRTIKTDPRTSVIPVLHMSATNISTPDQVRGLEGGADGYLVEPIAPDVLVATVRALLRMRAAEEEARESRRALQVLVSNLPGAAYRVASIGGALTFVSERVTELTGVEPAELVERSHGWWDLMEAHDRETAEQLASDAADRDEPLELMYRIRTRDGTVRWIWDRVVPVTSVDGRTKWWEGFATDVTERRQAQEVLSKEHTRLEQLVAERTQELQRTHEQLRLSERMAALGTLSAGLGHDLGNLLLPVRIRLAAMQEEGTFSDDLSAIQTALDYVERLLAGLRLLVLNPDAAPATTGTKIDEWWPTAEALFHSLPNARKILTHRIAPDLPPIEVAPAALTQAMFNLVQNAFDAIKNGAGSRVTVWAEPEPGGNGIQVGVTDDGPGMPAEVRVRCLEPFFSTKPRQFATGLGLSLVHGITQSSGGRVEIRSEPGQGTTFVLTFPVSRTRGLGKPAARTAVVSIEDSRLRGIVQSLLRAEGLEAQVSSNPDDAELWIVESRLASPQSVRDFLNRQEHARVVVVGETAPPHPRVEHVVATAGVRMIWGAIHAATLPLATGDPDQRADGP